MTKVTLEDITQRAVRAADSSFFLTVSSHTLPDITQRPLKQPGSRTGAPSPAYPPPGSCTGAPSPAYPPPSTCTGAPSPAYPPPGYPPPHYGGLYKSVQTCR
eukprot:1137505-Pelagomonas_calceolata.AAC.1